MMLEFLMYVNAVFYFFVLRKIIKQKHPDLIIFSIVNLIIFHSGIYLQYKKNLPFIIKGSLEASQYYLFFMIFSALVLLFRTKKKLLKSH